MLEFLKGNLPTVLVAMGLAIIVALIAVKLIRDKKNGKSSCGGSCGGCPSAGFCHKRENDDDK